MAEYIQEYSNLRCLWDSMADCKAKLDKAVHQRDIKRLADKLEKVEELLLGSVAGLQSSPMIELILDEISFGSLEVLTEEIRDYRKQLKAFESNGNHIDGRRINRELAPLEDAIARICKIEGQDLSVGAELPPDVDMNLVENQVSATYATTFFLLCRNVDLFAQIYCMRRC